MRIVHLSDIHFSKEKLSEFKQFYFKALLKDLDQNNKKEKIDFITITGDLIDKGGESFNSESYYKDFKDKFIEPMLTSLKLTKDNLLFVPGNHDINESEINEFQEEGILSLLKSNKKIKEFLENNKSTKENSIYRIKKFKQFEEDYYSGQEDCYISNFESCFIKNVSGIKVGFVCLNSAWRCSTKLPNDSLLLGTQQILNANEYMTNNDCDFIIGLIHHPIELFSKIEREEISNFLPTFGFNILLVGHNHLTESTHVVGNKGEIFFNAAKSAFNDPREIVDKHKSGYTILDIDFSTFKIKCNFRKYIFNGNRFDNDVDISENGIFSDTLKSTENLLRLKKHLEQIEKKENPVKLVNPSKKSIHKYDKILETLYKGDLIYNSNLYIKQKSLIAELEEKLSNKGIVIIEGPQLNGKTSLIKNFFINHEKYDFIDTIREQTLARQKRKNNFDDILDLYIGWGRMMLSKAERHYNIDKDVDENLSDLDDKDEFRTRIINNSGHSEFNNDLESLFHTIHQVISPYANYNDNERTVVISAHLDNFEAYSDSPTLTRLENDLGELNRSKRIVKDGILSKMKVVISTRNFPTNSLTNIVLRTKNLNKEEIKDLTNRIIIDDTTEADNIAEVIWTYTDGYHWFVIQFFKIFIKILIQGDLKPNLTLAEKIFKSPKYWKIEDISKDQDEEPKFISNINDILRRFPSKGKLEEFLNLKNPDIEKLTDFKNDLIIKELGLLKYETKPNTREPVVTGYGNWLIKNYFIKELYNYL